MRAIARTTVAAAIVLAAAVGTAMDARTVPPIAATVDATEPVPVDPPMSGTVYCPVVAVEDEDVEVTVTPVAEDAGPPATVRLEAGREVVDELRVPGGEPAVLAVTGPAATRPLTLSWSGSPVVVTTTTTGEQPIVQRCESAAAPRWHLAGFTTTLGNNAILHLFNPFSVDAVAEVRFATNDGPVALVSTADIAVPAGEAVQVDLDRAQPEVPDLGVVVDVRGGRLVAAGEMRFSPPDEESTAVRGRTVVDAVAEPAGRHLFPYGAMGGDTAYAWVQVMNPGDEEAIVSTTTSAPDSDSAADEEVRVPPGATVRLDLRGRSTRRTFATEVTVVNEAAVVATRIATRRREATTSADAAGPSPVATDWILSGVGDEDEHGVLDLYNPGSEPATVTLSPLGADAEVRHDIALEPNEQRGVPLADLGAAAAVASLRVHADAPVSAGLRSARDDGSPERFRTLPGFTETAWSGLATRPVTTHDPDLDRAPLPSPPASPVPS